MKRIYDRQTINEFIKKSKYHHVFSLMEIDYYLIQYKRGELVSSPFQEEALFQIVGQGTINIYFIRADGTRYALAKAATDYLLGDMDIFYPKSNHIYAEAADEVICITFSVQKHKKTLLENNSFLMLICDSLSHKIGAITAVEAAPATLEERVLSYMKYKCNSQILKGMEQAAFQLHCSTRQLQRIMNKNEVAGVVKKLGKGTYQLVK